MKKFRSMVLVFSAISLVGCGNQKEVIIESPTYYYEPTNDETLISKEKYYEPTEEERQIAYLMAYAQARDEEAFVQTLVTNVAINEAKSLDMNLIETFAIPGEFSGMYEGVPSYCIVNEDYSTTWITVTEDMLTEELKEAVDLAFTYDYTEGAISYVDAKYYELLHSNSDAYEPKDYFQEGNLIFIRQF